MIRMYHPCKQWRDPGRKHNILDTADEWGKVNLGKKRRRSQKGYFRVMKIMI